MSTPCSRFSMWVLFLVAKYPAEWRRFLVYAKLNHSRFSPDTGFLLEAVVSSVLLRHLYRKEKIAESTKKAAINLANAVVALFDQRWSPEPPMSRLGLHAYIGKLQPISHLDWIEAKLQELDAQQPHTN
jgi:hypothetical protein